MTKREHVIATARIAGYHGDHAQWVRAYVECGRLASRATLQRAWREGKRARERGMRCSCYECAPGARP